MSGVSQAPRVRVAPALDVPLLRDLFGGRVAVVVVHEFALPEVCDRVRDFVRERAAVSPYTHEVYEGREVKQLYFGVDRVGVPFNSTMTPVDTKRSKENYYCEAIPAIRRLRTVCAPYMSAIDRLRLELDELWPLGAHNASFEGRSMFVGIVRLMQPLASEASELYPHFDALPSAICPLDGQFAANIFMAVPPLGGELEVWDVAPVPPGGVLPADWRAMSGEPVRVMPMQGDLVIFNSRMPHAVRRFQGS